MEVVDSRILSSILQLSNYFAEHYGAEVVKSPVDLWEKHGPLFANLLSLGTNTFESSREFYDVLLRRFKLTIGPLAESLDISKASNGDLMEICKFHALLLEYMRKEQGDLLKQVLERLSSNVGFNNESLLKLFNHFDELYEDDNVDEWWSILRQNLDDEFATDSPKPVASSFATPKNSARRMRSVFSSAKRSPIVDAIDSPTMKFIRTERELKKVRKHLNETEVKLEDAENENASLLQENRELKVKMDTLRSDMSTDRNAIQRAEEDAEFWKCELDSRTKELVVSRQELDGAKQNIRNLLRQMENFDKEREAMKLSVEALSADKESLLRQLRDIRETNEADFQKWEVKELELRQKLQEALDECSNNNMNLATVRGLEESARSEINRLSKLLESAEFENLRSKQTIDRLEEDLERSRNTHLEAIRNERKDRENAVAAEVGKLEMADRTIARLNGELDLARKEKDEIKSLFDSLSEKSLEIGANNHQKEEESATIKSCLEAARDRIILLETKVKSKEEIESSLKKHLEQVTELFAKEKSLWNSTQEQYNAERAMLEKNWDISRNNLTNALQKSSEELESLKEKYAVISEKYDVEVAELKNIVSDQKSSIDKLQSEVSRLTNLYESEKEENEYFRFRSRFIENVSKIQRCGSEDSLNEALSNLELPLKKDGVTRTSSNRLSIIAETPRKSIGFSMEVDDLAKRTTLPPGFKLPTEKRVSLASSNRDSLVADETTSNIFDRSSILRMSMNSESSSLVTSTPSNFKQPFTPIKPEKDPLKPRNTENAPNPRCSFVAEESSSTTGFDENMKMGDTLKKLNGRRKSISVGLSNIFNRKPKE